MLQKVQKMGFCKIVKFLLIQLQSRASGTSRQLEIAPISNFLVGNEFLGQNQALINSHFGLDNFCPKECTLLLPRKKNVSRRKKNSIKSFKCNGGSFYTALVCLRFLVSLLICPSPIAFLSHKCIFFLISYIRVRLLSMYDSLFYVKYVFFSAVCYPGTNARAHVKT